MPHKDIARDPQSARECIPHTIVEDREQKFLAPDAIAPQPDRVRVRPLQQAHADRSDEESPIRGKGAVEKMISTATSKNSAIRRAR
ncbi:Hypothetical protein AJAP_31155 [Amycolatopsis japonica]|uniref:Uncharacterized protein n=1 Tax=Amycolatopsis japonica TaxID=208439 RepID=A0A075V1F7_9PSEU|nr:Hypothetical protein AJAP_31155 [Amycolatopsis japonica]